MFGFFGIFKSEKPPVPESHMQKSIKCSVLHREPLDNGPGVFVEIHSEAEHMVYVSNRGITPAYLNTPYDQWCREDLLESYVFATLDSAMDYFQGRKGGIKPDLISAIRRQSAA